MRAKRTNPEHKNKSTTGNSQHQPLLSIRPWIVWFNMKFNYVRKNILSGKKTAPSVNLKLPGYPQTWENFLFTFFPYVRSVTSRKQVYRSLFVKSWGSAWGSTNVNFLFFLTSFLPPLRTMSFFYCTVVFIVHRKY